MTDSRTHLIPVNAADALASVICASAYDVLEMLAEGMSEAGIIENFPELESADIRACLAFAADREHNLYTVAV
jgi:hypothetical protein